MVEFTLDGAPIWVRVEHEFQVVVEDVGELGADLVSGVEVASGDADHASASAAVGTAAVTVLALVLLLLLVVEICESVWIEVLAVAALAFDPGVVCCYCGSGCSCGGDAVVGEAHGVDGSGTTEEVVVFLADALGGFERR